MLNRIQYLLISLITIIALPDQFTYEIPPSQARLLASIGQQVLDNTTLSIQWTPFRINFTYLNSSSVSSQTQTLINKVFSITSTFFMKHLLVRKSPTNITWNSTYPTTWSGFEISKTIQSTTWNADYVFLVNVESDTSSKYLGYAAPQIIDSSTKRPKMGLISLNTAYFPTNLTNSSFETIVTTLIHEMTHGFGFIDTLYSFYYDSATGKMYNTFNYQTINSTTYLQTPRLLQLAKTYFNCSNMTGVQMENQGGDGTAASHFERSLLWKELMTGSMLDGDLVMTDFTFQLYQDTGFYRVAEYNPDTLSGWGYNNGCGFVNQYCKGGAFSEYCTNTDSCSYEAAGQGYCTTESLSNSCSYEVIKSENYDCRDDSNNLIAVYTLNNQYYGYDSVCVSGQINSQSSTAQGCYQYQCTGSKMSLIIANKTIPCPETGPVTLPAGLIGTITCPKNAAYLCTQQNECPSQCNQRGYCTRGTCTCIVGYSGKGCETTCSQYRRNEQCVNTCPTGTYLISAISYCIGCPANCATCSNYNLCLTCNSGYNLRGGFCDCNSLPTYPQQNTTTNNTQTGTNTTNSTKPNTGTNSTSNSTTNSTNSSSDPSQNLTSAADDTINSLNSISINNLFYIATVLSIQFV